MVHEGSAHFAQLLRRDLPNAERILVVGCGYDGGEVFSLAEALPLAFIEGFDIHLDPRLEDLQADRYHITRGDACAMHYPDESFDAVFYHHVIEHVPHIAGLKSENYQSVSERVWEVSLVLYATMDLGHPNTRSIQIFASGKRVRISRVVRSR
jgi:SAM-dependent methyltransferase